MKNYLFAPGPTPIPTETLLAMALPIDYHRASESVELLGNVAAKLKYVFQTKNDVMILTSSGTGAMEATITNLLSSNDRVTVIRSGKFGERWGEICAAYGIRFDPINIEWGRSVDPQQVEDQLNRYPETKAVLATLCETSTGALHDIKTLGEILQGRETLLVVDAVSALCADDLQMDHWGVDAVISCSHKGLMTPPGIGLVSLSDQAWKSTESSDLPKFYFDLRQAQDAGNRGSTPYTPAITFIKALDRALDHIHQEKIENVLMRHAYLAHATRGAVKAMGLKLFAQEPANTLTSICLPNRVDGQELLEMMRNRYG
ncbi:MAG: alanine--glyoxylate aminotransferase family protein, partial [Candidatus Poribacteria bacterium]|nr:alanine--glyoxylate aminotransferase family protein [Candidatus Poribacteria bacterium]